MTRRTHPRRSLDQVAPLSFGCRMCSRFAKCGGMHLPKGGFFCTDACDSGTCGPGCMSPKHPERYNMAVVEVEGFGFEGLGPIRCPIHLPRALSVIQHGSLFRDCPAVGAELGWAAVPLRSVIRFPSRPRTGRRPWTEIHKDGGAMRRSFGLAPDAKVVLSCVDKDPRIEPVWRFIHKKGFVRYFRRLGFAAVITPNFSLFDNESRYQHEYNRKRALIVGEEFSRFGIPVVPSFHTLAPGDLRFWRDFLRHQPGITCLAEEFQTGLRDNPERAKAMIDELSRLQDDLGRSLHLVAIGGPQFKDHIASRFQSSTMISSQPFLLAMNGRRMVERPRGSWGRVRDKSNRGYIFLHNHRLMERVLWNVRRRSKLRRISRRHAHSIAGAQLALLPAAAPAADRERLELRQPDGEVPARSRRP